MNPVAYSATTERILRQLKADRRTVVMIALVPTLLMVLLYFMYQNTPAGPDGRTLFDRIAIVMLGILPFGVMFVVTSIAMLRERVTGKLVWILATPLAKMDLLAGYGSAFSAAAVVQAGLACIVAFGLLGVSASGSVLWVLVIAILVGVLGVSLGLLCSAFARTEFQAVQFMPVLVIPQFLLCGLLVPRDDLPDWLRWASNVLPLSYAVEALQEVANHPGTTGVMIRDLIVVVGFVAVGLALGAATLRRRTR